MRKIFQEIGTDDSPSSVAPSLRLRLITLHESLTAAAHVPIPGSVGGGGGSPLTSRENLAPHQILRPAPPTSLHHKLLPQITARISDVFFAVFLIWVYKRGRVKERWMWERNWPGGCLVTPNSKLWHYAKRRFPVTLNLRYMHGVLNVNEIKN